MPAHALDGGRAREERHHDPITCVRRSERFRAIGLGRYFSASIASSTFARVTGRTLLRPFRTRETVPTPTPARAATSVIVGGGFRKRFQSG